MNPRPATPTTLPNLVDINDIADYHGMTARRVRKQRGAVIRHADPLTPGRLVVSVAFDRYPRRRLAAVAEGRVRVTSGAKSADVSAQVQRRDR